MLYISLIVEYLKEMEEYTRSYSPDTLFTYPANITEVCNSLLLSMGNHCIKRLAHPAENEFEALVAD
jgi:hypothetical protein